jgi:nucleolar complex protein 3
VYAFRPQPRFLLLTLFCSPPLSSATMPAPGHGKKRTSNAKQSSISKRHKTSAKSSSKSKSKRPPPTDSTALPAASEFVSPSAFPADKPSKESAKKDRKGKGPAYIPVVKGDDLSDDSDEGGMDVDEELEGLANGADFLTALDEKGMSA